MRVLGISGSLRRDSYNTKLLRAAEELLPAVAELEIWEELKAVPPFDEDDEPGTEVVASLRDAVAAADVLIFATGTKRWAVRLTEVTAAADPSGGLFESPSRPGQSRAKRSQVRRP